MDYRLLTSPQQIVVVLAEGPLVGGVQTAAKGSRGRCTWRMPSLDLLRTSAFKVRYPSALLPLPAFRPILLHLEAGSEPYPRDVDESVTPVEGSRLGNTTPPGTQPLTFALFKIYLGSCYLFIPCDHLFHCLYVQMARERPCLELSFFFSTPLSTSVLCC